MAPASRNSGISIRRIGENRVTIEIDGVPLPQQFDVGNFADCSHLTIDPAIIQRIKTCAARHQCCTVPMRSAASRS